MSIDLGPLQAHLTRRLCWIRLFGFGLKVADRTKTRPLYSDRLHEVRIGRIGVRLLGRGQ